MILKDFKFKKSNSVLNSYIFKSSLIKTHLSKIYFTLMQIYKIYLLNMCIDITNYIAYNYLQYVFP